MIAIDQFRVSNDGKKLILWAHVSRAEGFENVYIDTVTIKPAGAMHEIAESFWGEDYLKKITFADNRKWVEIVITPEECDLAFNKHTFSEDLFFVQITAKGTPSIDIPCNLDRPVVGATFDNALLYQRVMGFTKELHESACSTPSKSFIDFILLWNAFKSSVETEHWNSAIKFYNMLFSKTCGSKRNNKPCGCHGRVSL